VTPGISFTDLVRQHIDVAVDQVPAGTYELEVESCKARATDVVPIYRVVAAPDPRDVGKKVMAGVMSFNGGAGRITVERLIVGFGLPETFFTAETTLADICEALVGRVVSVDLGALSHGKHAGRNELPFAPDIRLLRVPPSWHGKEEPMLVEVRRIRELLELRESRDTEPGF
jgi:hypothetical protein